MELRGDLHVHTCRSPDSDTTLEQALSAAKAAGLDFLALTDHNLPPDPSLFPAGRRQGILVIPGVEYSTDRGHLLGLFLERPCPPAEEGRVTFSQAVEWIRQSGGLAVLAHPFQSTAQTAEERMAQLESLAPQLDGLEVCNRRATKKRRSANSLAEQAKARIERAKELLTGPAKVYEIAEQLGYKDVDYFHKKFKKYVGVSPNEYRRSLTAQKPQW